MTPSTPYSSGEGWIEWHGGENPVPGQRVEVRTRVDERRAAPSEAFSVMWANDGAACDIIAYRVVSPGLPVGEGQGALADARTHRAPDGCVLVPIEPSEAMRNAGVDVDPFQLDESDVKAVWSAMIAAAQQEQANDRR